MHTSIINYKIHNFASIHLLCTLLPNVNVCRLPVNPVGKIRTGKYECHVWEPGIWHLLSPDNHLGSVHGWVVAATLHYTCWQLPLSWPMVGLFTDQQICLILASAVSQVSLSLSLPWGRRPQMCPIGQGQQWHRRPDTPTLCSYTWPVIITLTRHWLPQGYYRQAQKINYQFHCGTYGLSLLDLTWNSRKSTKSLGFLERRTNLLFCM